MASSRTAKVIALSLGRALTQLVGIVSVAVMARVLSQHDYATYRQTFVAYLFAAPLLTLALPQALYFFLPRNEGRQRTVLVEVLLLLSVMGALFSVFLLLGGTRLLALRFSNPDLRATLLLLIPYPLFIFPASALGACLVSQNRVMHLTIYNVLTKVLLVSALVGVCLLRPSPITLVLANVAVAAVDLCVALWLMFRACPGPVEFPSISRMLSMVKFCGPVGLASIFGSLCLGLYKLIVSSMCTPEQFAVYANGAIQIPLVGMITGSISTVILADMSRMCSQGNHAEALALFRKAAVRSAAILLPAMVFLLVCAEPFIVTLYSAKYRASVTPFRLYLLILPIRIVHYGSALMALGKTNAILFRSIFDLVINALLSVVLVTALGPLGAVVATICTLYLWAVPYNLHTIGKGFGVSPLFALPLRDLGRILWLSLLASPSAIVPLYLLRGHPEPLKLAAGGGYCFVAAALLHRHDLLPLPQGARSWISSLGFKQT